MLINATKCYWLGFLPFILLLASCCSPSGKGASGGALSPTGEMLRKVELPDELRDRILALDREAVSDRDVQETLARGPAPRILLIRGGVPGVRGIMESFGEFLVKMGYPLEEVQHPHRQSFTYSPYTSTKETAGYVAWYYERSGLRPMLIGHSQGGVQTVRILHELNGAFHDHLVIWNPYTGKPETRDQITDPLDGTPRSVVKIEVSYASAIGAGGLARLNPTHWNMLGRLRTIPDTTAEFVGFRLTPDFIGGDLFGFGPGNDYKPNGKATVRNVQLPPGSSHFWAPAVSKLAEKPEAREWINAYRPDLPLAEQKPMPSDRGKIVYAAEVWHSVKRHWVLELQRLIKARNHTAAN